MRESVRNAGNRMRRNEGEMLRMRRNEGEGEMLRTREGK
jgi:hypothetical protein